MPGMTFTGDKELQKAFRELPKEMKKEGRKIHRKVAREIILRDAKRQIAVESGFMKRKLRVRAAKNRKGGRLPRTVFGSAVLVLAEVFYARFVLLSRRLRGGGRRPGDRTLRNALYGNSAVIDARLTAEYKRALPRITREARK